MCEKLFFNLTQFSKKNNEKTKIGGDKKSTKGKEKMRK